MNDGLVASITRVTPLVDQADMNTVVGQIEIEAVTGPNYYGSSPFRLGWGGLAAWILRLNSATVLGQRWIFTAFTVCLLNSVVNATNPVFAEQLNAAGQVIATTLLTQLACVNIQVLAAAYAIRLRGTGSGSSADANGFGGPGMQVPAVQMRPSPPPP
jgi:subtilase family serine protease